MDIIIIFCVLFCVCVCAVQVVVHFKSPNNQNPHTFSSTPDAVRWRFLCIFMFAEAGFWREQPHSNMTCVRAPDEHDGGGSRKIKSIRMERIRLGF